MLTEMDLKPQTEIGLRAELQIKKTAGMQLFDFIPLHWGGTCSFLLFTEGMYCFRS